MSGHPDFERIDVGPIEGGWRVQTSASDLVLVFRSGAWAERQAYKLAQTLADRGTSVEVLVRDKQNLIVGSVLKGPPPPLA